MAIIIALILTIFTKLGIKVSRANIKPSLLIKTRFAGNTSSQKGFYFNIVYVFTIVKSLKSLKLIWNMERS